MNETTKALKIQSLVKSYGEVEVLRDISVDLEPGEFLVLVGPSGCGKSTLLNCIAGLEETTAGQIHIAGRDVTQLPPRERDIAMVFQSYALYPTMSVADNISFGMRIRKRPSAEIRQRVAEVANLLQIDALLDRRPAQLSGGQRQRVAMGRALVRDPALFLFDEPLSNLDAKLRVEMRAEIKRVHESTDATIVYVTHDQVEAMTLASKIVVLEGGRIQQVGSPDEIYHAPDNTFVADFMGSPPMNLVPATLSERRLDFGEGSGIEIDEPPRSLEPGSPLLVGIRPESFTPGEHLRIQTEAIENTGSDTYLRFRLSDTMVTARLPGKFQSQVGKQTALAVDTRDLCFFAADSGKRLT